MSVPKCMYVSILAISFQSECTDVQLVTREQQFIIQFWVRFEETKRKLINPNSSSKTQRLLQMVFLGFALKQWKNNIYFAYRMRRLGGGVHSTNPNDESKIH